MRCRKIGDKLTVEMAFDEADKIIKEFGKLPNPQQKMLSQKNTEVFKSTYPILKQLVKEIEIVRIHGNVME